MRWGCRANAPLFTTFTTSPPLLRRRRIQHRMQHVKLGHLRLRVTSAAMRKLQRQHRFNQLVSHRPRVDQRYRQALGQPQGGLVHGD